MFDIFRLLTQSLGSPKDPKSDQVAISVVFTTFLSFVVTMTIVTTNASKSVLPQGSIATRTTACIADKLVVRESAPPTQH
jgi:hypothetical protein